MPIDYERVEAALHEAFTEIQGLILAEAEPPPIPESLKAHFETIFATNVQAYREALLGCASARFHDRAVNIRLPYIGQGPSAFNGRTLDETVVNPFLQRHRIPSSRGPYLAMFRRDFQFEASKRQGLRDKAGYDAFLDLITALEAMNGDEAIGGFIAYLLYKFAKLREAAEVPLARLQRISQEQYETLITSLLATQSGGRLPVVLVVAALRSIRDFFGADWQINFQGINVADAAGGAGGDITVMSRGHIVFAAEVTERPIGRSRVVATFNTKIAPNTIEDYLFFAPLETLDADARRQARQYFAQGHEVNFVEVKSWVLNSLATMGKRGRALFHGHLITLLNDQVMPRSIKVAWNGHIANLMNPPATQD